MPSNIPSNHTVAIDLHILPDITDRKPENSMSPAATDHSEKSDEALRYSEEERDLMDEVPSPSLNPWISLALLILLGFVYLWIWKTILLKGP